MFDTNFFINTYEIKKEIITNKYSHNDSEYIFDIFEKHRSKTPFIFNIETTNVCNMKCIFCQRPKDLQRKVEHMSMDTFKKIVNQMHPQNKNELEIWNNFVNKKIRNNNNPSENNFYYDIVSKCVTLHGFGEPLLDPFLPERIMLLSKKNIPTYFSCNPCNIKIDFIKKLFEAGLGYIKFAIDSLDDAESKRLRGNKANFTESYKKILEIINLKEKTNSETVIVTTMLNSKNNLDEIEKFLELWKNKNVYTYAKSLDNTWLLKQNEENQKENSNQSHYKKQYCESAWISLTILADGTVVPCTQDINASWNFGNINKNTLEEIWNSKKYNNFRKLQLTKDIPNDFMCHSKCDLDIVTYFLNKK